MQVKDSTNINFKNNGEVIFSRGLDLHDFRYKYVETVNSSVNYKDWQDDKFRPFRLTKRKEENYYIITDENDNRLFEGTAVEVKRWMKSEMQRYENEYQEYARSMIDMREEEN